MNLPPKLHRLCLVLGFLAFPFFLSAQPLSPADQTAIQQVMDRQEDAWNQGDIDAFMQGYWKSDELVFVGSSGPQYGWETTRDGYKRRYPDRAAMGTLTFDIIRTSSLGKRAALLIGRFSLAREQGDLSGYFTLVWRKIKGQWLIVSDHTSSEN